MTVGNCDPANLIDEMLHEMAGEPRVAYGTETFADAVDVMLRRGSFARAMWAARVCAALENHQEGESLTQRILNDREVAEALAQVRKKAASWAEYMLAPEERNAPAEDTAPPDEAAPQSRGRRSERLREDENY
jgi:hypothetical protein